MNTVFCTTCGEVLVQVPLPSIKAKLWIDPFKDRSITCEATEKDGERKLHTPEVLEDLRHIAAGLEQP